MLKRKLMIDISAAIDGLLEHDVGTSDLKSYPKQKFSDDSFLDELLQISELHRQSFEVEQIYRSKALFQWKIPEIFTEGLALSQPLFFSFFYVPIRMRKSHKTSWLVEHAAKC